MSRVMIVDFDIHHGNGCQSVFYSSNQVLHVSIHKQFHRISSSSRDGSSYSSSSSRSVHGERAEGNEVGRLAFLGSGAGLGFNVNIPLDGSDTDGLRLGLGDVDYLAVFEEIIIPLALEFIPELVFIPAGFDTGI